MDSPGLFPNAGRLVEAGQTNAQRVRARRAVEAEQARLLASLPPEYQEQATAFVGALKGVGNFDLEEVMPDEDLYG